MMNNNETNTIDDLFDAWRRQGSRVDKVAREHPVTRRMVGRGARRLSRHRRLLLLSLLRAALCLAALVWLAWLFDRRVADTLDLVPHLFAAALLLYNVAGSLRTALMLGRHPVAATPPAAMLRLVARVIPASRGADFPPRGLQFSRTAAAAAVIAVVLIAATPVYDGRSMSAHSRADRQLALANANMIIDKILA